MDKTEYNQKLDELSASVQDKDYARALEIVDSIDWRRVKSIRTLNMAADVYERNKEYEKEREVLKIAYNHSSIGRGVLSRLVEVNLKMGDVDEAERYFREFSKVALNDNSRCLLQYKLYKAKNAPLDAQIAVLEEYREREYTERWAYELAKLYAKAGDRQKCVETCDDLILWFSEGKYVVRAMELKMRFEPLTPSQKALYSEIRATGYRQNKTEETEQEQSPAGDVLQDMTDGTIDAAAVSEKSEADLDAERIARILSGEYSPDEEEAPAETEEAAAAPAEPAEETEIPAPEPEAASGEEETPAPVDLSGLDDDDDEEEEEMASDAAAFRAERASRAERAAHAEPEAFRNRIFRSFQDVFSNLSKDDTDERIERPEENDEETAEDENGLNYRVRELEPEEEAGESASEGPGRSQYAGMKTEDFNLDDFLSETMGSFAGELASGSFAGTSTTDPAQDSGSMDLSELNKAVSAAGRDEKDTRGAGLVAPSVEESLAALRFEFPEEKEEAAADAGTSGSTGFSDDMPTAPEISTRADAALREGDQKEAEEEAWTDAEMPLEEAPLYNEELEIPDPEPAEEDRRSRTITLSKIGQNTVPVSLNQILDSETPEERRIRILNKARPTRMSEEQLGIFTYFARIPGMDTQILEALNGVYRHAGERTSLHGNIAVMGAVGTGKSRLTRGLIIAMCRDMGLEAAKVARISGGEMNKKDPAQVVSRMAGGFLAIEDVSLMTADTVEKLNQAMEFRTDCMVLIIEDEKSNMRAFLKKHPQFAAKFEKVISIPVFTNDELVTFARTYATENGCKMDDLGILALYTKIGNNQTEEEPMTIARVKDMVDDAIHHASRGRKKNRRGKERDRWIILHEKDFE